MEHHPSKHVLKIKGSRSALKDFASFFRLLSGRSSSDAVLMFLGSKSGLNMMTWDRQRSQPQKNWPIVSDRMETSSCSQHKYHLIALFVRSLNNSESSSYDQRSSDSLIVL